MEFYADRPETTEEKRLRDIAAKKRIERDLAEKRQQYEELKKHFEGENS